MRKILELELSEDSYFAKAYIRNRLVHEASDMISALPIENAGLRFMAVSCFHDAKIVEIINTEKYGKDCVLLRIDFKGSTTEFKKGYRKFDIYFVNAEYIEIPVKFRELLIISLNCMQQSQSLITDMELAYFTGVQEHRCTCKIMCSGIAVKPFVK